MTLNTVEKIFDSFNNLKVLIIGDVMIDNYIYGKVNRISPEAPVPIVSVYKRERRLGGAANVALNIQALGATPILCSLVGDDFEGDGFIKILESHNITSEGIIKSTKRITTVKERILSGSQHMLRVDSETDRVIDDSEEDLLLDRIKYLLGEVDAVIFEDYDKGVLNKRIIQETIQLAIEKGIPTTVDPKKRNFFCYEKATLFKPNLKELREGLKVDLEGDDKQQISDAVGILKEQLKAENVMITLSERGIYIDGQEKHFLPAHIRNIADVSGAGDTVISIATLCTALKLSPRFTAELSNLGGGLVCEHLGVVPIKKDLLFEEAIKHQLFEKQLLGNVQ